MDDEQAETISLHTDGLEQVVVDIISAIKQEHGMDVALSVLINVATTMLARVMLVATPESRELLAQTIELEISMKIREGRAAREAEKAVDAAKSRAKAGHMTCYPDNTKKH